MGLESVELVLAFEEVFRISISDQEAEKMRTPRDVIDCIAAKLDAQTSGRSVMRQRDETAWQQLTQALRGSGIFEGSVTRNLFLEDMFPDRGSRRRQWRALKYALQARKWPSLRWLGLSTDFQPEFKTLGDLSEWLSFNKLQQLTEEEAQNMTRGDIAFLVKHIVLEQLGLPYEKYGEDKRFIEDLGVD